MSSGAKCRFCGVPIRWATDVDSRQRLPLDVAAVDEGGSYAVAGADSARRIPKSQRAGRRLYRPHKETCARWEEAQAFLARERADRRERATIRKQREHERATMPANVTMLRNWRRPK